MYQQDTIAAIATAPGEGGVAIVRLSGGEAEAIAARIFVRSGKENGPLESHRLYHGRLRDPRSGRVVDEVLLTIMRKPRSYTGESVVEIHGHGGTFVVREVLGIVLAEGARQAEPGEFTKRAFLNGRVDLAQAEAVLDLVRARTGKSAELALQQGRGGLSHWVQDLREELINLLVQVEAAIDFPEEEIELLRRRELRAKISALARKILDISRTYVWGRLFRDGARVCICGRPNVGKSSLLNALLGEERVIVTPIAGTTRDVVEEAINLDGLPAVFWDTAGIHETEDQIERIGVELSRRHAANADAALVVLDGSEPLTSDDEVLLGEIAQRKFLAVVNKSDLPQMIAAGDLRRLAAGCEIVAVSAKTGAGITKLKESLRNLLVATEVEASVVITNVRHRSALQRTEAALSRAAASLGEGYAPEFVAMDLHDARSALEEIIGVIPNENILERIFSQFCIGK
jgi:tRNA modification GTPase